MKKNISSFFKELLKLTLLGIFVSVIVGLYRYASHFVINISNQLFTSSDIYTKTFAILLAVFLVFVGYAIIRFEGTVQSGGLSQLKLMINNPKIKFRYFFAIPLMFFNSLLSFFIGAPLGSEAPSVFMGGATNYGLNEVFKEHEKKDDDYLGMALGFSCAFNTPIAGFFYGFEECLKSIKIVNIFKLAYLMLLSYGLSFIIYPEPVFYFSISNNLDYQKIYVFIFLIIINFVIAFIILFLVPKMKILLDKHYNNFFVKYRYFIMAFISIILLASYPILSGNGNNLINYVLDKPLLYIAIIYLIVRIILFILSANSMMTGGLVLPILAIGALSGYISFYISDLVFGIGSDYLTLFVVVGMTSLFAAVNSAPLTGIFLSLSFCNYENILMVLLASFVVTTICFILIKICHLDDITDARYKLLKTSRRN